MFMLHSSITIKITLLYYTFLAIFLTILCPGAEAEGLQYAGRPFPYRNHAKYHIFVSK
jgi:hypothetical protein